MYEVKKYYQITSKLILPCTVWHWNWMRWKRTTLTNKTSCTWRHFSESISCHPFLHDVVINSWKVKWNTNQSHVCSFSILSEQAIASLTNLAKTQNRKVPFVCVYISCCSTFQFSSDKVKALVSYWIWKLVCSCVSGSIDRAQK